MNLTAIMKQAEKTLLDSGKHPPTLLVTFEGLAHPTRLTIPSFPATPQQRQHALFLKGKQCAEQYGSWKVQRVWFIGEAWLSGLEANVARFVAPSLDSKRREALI